MGRYCRLLTVTAVTRSAQSFLLFNQDDQVGHQKSFFFFITPKTMISTLLLVLISQSNILAMGFRIVKFKGIYQDFFFILLFF